MARDGALQSLELPPDAGVDADPQPVGSGIEVTRASPGQSAPRASFGKVTVPWSGVNSACKLCCQCLHSC